MKRRIFKILAVCMAAVLLTSSSTSLQVYADTKEDIEEQKEDAEEALDQVEELLEQLEDDKANLEDYIQKVDAEIVAIQLEIYDLEKQIEKLEAQIKKTTKELKKAKKEEKSQYKSMQKRIQFLYENGNMDYLSAMLSADTMASVLNRSEYVSQISEYDYNLLMSLISTRQKIAAEEALLESDKLAAEDLKAENEATEEALQLLLADKQKELAATQSSIDDTMEQIEEYERVIAQYEDELRELEEEAEEIYDDDEWTGGQLQWPCPASHRITSGFGPRDTGIPGASRYHNGIDIGVPTGNNVVAAEGGTVIAATYNSGRGYYCVINHGSGVTTLYQHCTKILVSAGQKVKRGDVVALSGNTGISSGPHLHFEVRINGTPVDPVPYLK